MLWKNRQTALASAVALALCAHGAARAQTGPFVPAQSYWMGPFGSAGVGIVGGEIWIDVNGNGLQEPGTDTYHPIPSGLASGWTFRLTPSRRVMVAFTSNGLSCPGTATSIRLYDVPTGDGANLTQLGTQQSIGGCIQAVGFSDDTTDPARTAYFREPPDLSGEADILWWDLITGVAATSQFAYVEDYGFVDFAPSGTMAWVQHGLNAPTGTQYSIVNLCPPTLGDASQPGLTHQTEVLRAHVEMGATELIVVARTLAGDPVAEFVYDDCALPPPLVGACCLPGGGCLPGTTQLECEIDLGGIWGGAASSCSTAACPPPPSPELEVSKVGPANVERGIEYAYTLTARNDGTAPATNVTVVDSLPALVQFVSASDGGTWNAGTRKVTWNLDTMDPAAVLPLTLTVRAPCSGTTVVNDTYRIVADGVGTVAGSPDVVTTLDDANTTPLQITLSAEALAPEPLGTGDRVRQTLTLTNTIAQARPGLNFNIFASPVSEIVEIVDDGGGTVTGSPAIMLWVGTIPASATIDVIWEVEIKECRGPDPTTEVPNNGIPLSVRTQCFQNAGFVFPSGSFAVAGNPFALRLDSTTRPAQSGDGTTFMTVGRPGEEMDFELRFIYADSPPAPACGMSLTLPLELIPVGDPPFIGTPPAGTAWDPGTQTISWAGQPPPSDSVVVAFRGVLDENGCLATLDAAGSHGSCASFLDASLAVASVPVPPAGSHLVGLQTTGGLHTWVPGATEWTPLLCGSFTELRGVGRTDDGTLWVAGNPTFKINATTLDFEMFPQPFLDVALQMDHPFDAAGDPRDGTVVFSGYHQAVGLRVRRYDPSTSLVSFILNDTSPQTYGPGNSVVVADDGFIGVQAAGNVLHIDPDDPPAFQAWTDGSVQGLGGLCHDTDGNYLAVDYGASPRRLWSVDVGSGAFTALFDFDPYLSGGTLMSGVDAAPGGEVYTSTFSGEAVELDRSGGMTVAELPGSPSMNDLLWVDTGGTVAMPDPTPPMAVLRLSPGTPNPVASSTTLRFSIPIAGAVRLELFDVSGRRVRTFVNGRLEAGGHSARWDGRSDAGHRLHAGVYFLQLAFDGQKRKVKIVIAP